jgi:signal recognition particle GTPase
MKSENDELHILYQRKKLLEERIRFLKKNTTNPPKQLTDIPLINLSDIVGRDEDMENINNHLTVNKGVVLIVNGIGGIGKTSTALSFINSEKYIANYNHIAWITIIS